MLVFLLIFNLFFSSISALNISYAIDLPSNQSSNTSNNKNSNNTNHYSNKNNINSNNNRNNTSRIFNLQNAYYYATQNNRNYKIAQQQYLLDLENEKQSFALLLPQVNFVAAHNINDINSKSMHVTYQQPSFGLQLQQVIFDFSKYSLWVKTKYANKLADYKIKMAKQQLIIDVVESYFDLLYAMDTINSLYASIDAAKIHVAYTEKMFTLGQLTAVDVNDAKAELDMINIKILQAKNSLIDKQNKFIDTVGFMPNRLAVINQNLNLFNLLINKTKLADNQQLVGNNPQNRGQNYHSWHTQNNDIYKKKLYHLAIKNNISLLSSQLAIEMAKEDIQIARAGHMPQISVTGGYNYNGDIDILNTVSKQNAAAFTNSNANTTQANIGLQLSLPIYSGGLVDSKVKQAINQYNIANLNHVNLIKSITNQISGLILQNKINYELINAEYRYTHSAKNKLDSDVIANRLGTRSTIDLLNAQKNYNDAIAKLNQAKYQYIASNINLLYCVDQIDEQIISSINQILISN